MFQVVKRDGEIDNFRIDKITKAIKKAYDATNKQFSDDMLDMLALHVTSDFQKKIKKRKNFCRRYSGQCGECSDPGRIQ